MRTTSLDFFDVCTKNKIYFLMILKKIRMAVGWSYFSGHDVSNLFIFTTLPLLTEFSVLSSLHDSFLPEETENQKNKLNGRGVNTSLLNQFLVFSTFFDSNTCNYVFG